MGSRPPGGSNNRGRTTAGGPRTWARAFVRVGGIVPVIAVVYIVATLPKINPPVARPSPSPTPTAPGPLNPAAGDAGVVLPIATSDPLLPYLAEGAHVDVMVAP